MSLKIKQESFESDNAKRFTLRMDSKLFESISAVAKYHRRSVAKEIEQAISDYLAALSDSEQDID